MNIDFAELSQEALNNVATDESTREIAIRAIKDPNFGDHVCNALDSNPVLVLAVKTAGAMANIQAIICFAFEYGRLYGRSEVVNETLERVE